MVVQVQARRLGFQVNPGFQGRGVMTNRSYTTGKPLMPRFREKPLSFRHRETVPQTDTGGRVENTKAFERTRVKELGKIAP